MAGYELDHAWNFLEIWNFYPEGTPYMKSDQLHAQTKFEETSDIGLDGTITCANPAGSMNIMVLFDDT